MPQDNLGKFFSLIEEYKFDSKMIKIAIKISQLRNAINSNDFQHIKQLTNKIHNDTDFEGIPYIEKTTNKPEVLKIKK